MKAQASNTYSNQKGQALLFVIVAATVALAIGINTSVRTISSISRTTRTDTASRALAAAEGGIEQYLSLSTPELEGAIEGGQNCPIGEDAGGSGGDGYCVIEFKNTTDDVITSKATLTVSAYEPETYEFDLESGQVKEVNLYDYNSGDFYPASNPGGDAEVKLCWNPDPRSEIMYIAYNEDGVQARGGLTGENAPESPYESSGFDSASDSLEDGYINCETVNLGPEIYGLRIRSVGGLSHVGVFPVDELNLPLQGYTIKSVGSIAQEGNVTATREITIIRSLPYLPVAFDYALYSEGAISK